jgi:hypothetical protein
METVGLRRLYLCRNDDLCLFPAVKSDLLHGWFIPNNTAKGTVLFMGAGFVLELFPL